MRRAVRVTKFFDPKGRRTRSEFAEDCDINAILKRFVETGVLEHEAKYQGRYGDFLGFPQTLQEAQNQVRYAEEMFHTIPPEIRETFSNSPQKFLECVEAAQTGDEKALRRLQDHGLLKAGKDAKVPQKSSEAPEAPSPSASGGSVQEPSAGT